MAKGGARARSGPAPDPNALGRERDAGEWTELPAEGRKGPVPDWPFAVQYYEEEVLWAKLWGRPQAVQWEREHLHDSVALYVRRFCEAAEPEAGAALTTVVRQLAEDLGVSKSGMLRNKWRIGGREELEPAGGQVRKSSRDRLQVVQ